MSEHLKKKSKAVSFHRNSTLADIPFLATCWMIFVVKTVYLFLQVQSM